MRKSLLLLWQILLLPASSIFNRFHMEPDKCPSGPVWVMYSNARDLLLTNEFVNTTVSDFGMWKALVSSRISMLESAQWRVRCNMYRSLRLYTTVLQCSEIWPWWHYALKIPSDTYKCKTMFRLVINNCSWHDPRQGGFYTLVLEVKSLCFYTLVLEVKMAKGLFTPKTRVFSAAEILLRIYQNPIHLNGTRWRTRFWRRVFGVNRP